MDLDIEHQQQQTLQKGGQPKFSASNEGTYHHL